MKHTTLHKGFTLIDVLLGASIFAMVLAALVASISGTIKAGNNLVESNIAGNLAREGIEAMEHTRNIHNLRGLSWGQLVQGKYSTNEFWRSQGSTVAFSKLEKSGGKLCLTIEANSTDLPWSFTEVPCGAQDQGKLFLKNDTYTHVDTGEPTQYRRVIQLENTSQKIKQDMGLTPLRDDGSLLHNEDIITVTSTTWWKDGTQEKNVTLTKLLTHWQ